jgi:two-component system LytT family response regulator
MTASMIYIVSGKLINAEDIIQLQADVNYTRIHLKNGQEIMVATTLKKMEVRVQHCSQLIRVNKSSIVNLDYVKDFNSKEIVLNTGEVFTLARRRKKHLSEKIAYFQY